LLRYFLGISDVTSIPKSDSFSLQSKEAIEL